MNAEVKVEELRLEQEDGQETLQLLVGVEVTASKDEKGQKTELRRAVSQSITRLTNLLRDSKNEVPGEKQIKVETVQPEGRPYRVSRKTFGEEVPGMPWSPIVDDDEEATES